MEEDLLFVLAIFTIAVFAVFLFLFSNKHVCGHFKNQQKETLAAYKHCPNLWKRKKNQSSVLLQAGKCCGGVS